jgi:hypothetical protein
VNYNVCSSIIIVAHLQKFMKHLRYFRNKGKPRCKTYFTNIKC